MPAIIGVFDTSLTARRSDSTPTNHEVAVLTGGTSRIRGHHSAMVSLMDYAEDWMFPVLFINSPLGTAGDGLQYSS